MVATVGDRTGHRSKTAAKSTTAISRPALRYFTTFPHRSEVFHHFSRLRLTRAVGAPYARALCSTASKQALRSSASNSVLRSSASKQCFEAVLRGSASQQCFEARASKHVLRSTKQCFEAVLRSSASNHSFEAGASKHVLRSTASKHVLRSRASKHVSFKRKLAIKR